MSTQRGRGGMGSHKHGVSGTPGPNRRELQERARQLNKMNERVKHPTETFATVEELMRKRRTR